MTNRQPTHYEVLELGISATGEQIRRAYLRLVRLWHPDTNTSDEAHARTARLNITREVLLDHGRRTAYDRTLRLTRPAPMPPRPPAGSPRAGSAPMATARRSSRPAPASRAAHDEPAPAASAQRARVSAVERRFREQQVLEQRHQREAAEAARRAAEPLGWTDKTLVAGHQYRSRAGIYEVLAVRDRMVDVRYAGGLTVTIPRDILWRQWHAHVHEPEAAASAPAPSELTEPAICDAVTRLARIAPPASAVVETGELLAAVGQATITDLRTGGRGLWIVPALHKDAACARAIKALRAAGVVLEAGVLRAGSGPSDKRQAWFYKAAEP